jgi:hypothetical protein
MIVPSDQSAPPTVMPSETSLLMALADMNKQGRIEGKPLDIRPKVSSPKTGGINSISPAGGTKSDESPKDAVVIGKGLIY